MSCVGMLVAPTRYGIQGWLGRETSVRPREAAVEATRTGWVPSPLTGLSGLEVSEQKEISTRTEDRPAGKAGR